MKNKPARILMFCLLAFASISAYTFLSIVATPDEPGRAKSAASYNIEEYEERMDADEAAIALPDIYLLKKLIEAGKRLVPAS
jgi:hypothetical protein